MVERNVGTLTVECGRPERGMYALNDRAEVATGYFKRYLTSKGLI